LIYSCIQRHFAKDFPQSWGNLHNRQRKPATSIRNNQQQKKALSEDRAFNIKNSHAKAAKMSDFYITKILIMF